MATRSNAFLVIAAMTAACSSASPGAGGADSSVSDVVSASDVVGVTDATAPVDAATADVVTPADTGAAPSCGTERPTISGIRGTEGLVIGPDGTIYYSQSGGVGRLAPGGSPQRTWVRLSGASTVWGLVLDPSRRRLYVGSPANSTVYAVDLSADPPTSSALVTSAGQPNGLTLAADGTLYYSDFGGGHVYSVTPDGMRTRVTTSRISGANGVAFGPDGALYVASYQAGTLIKLTLSGGMESARETVATALGSPDGVAFDADGRIYVGDNRGRLLRLDADGSNPEVLGSNISAAASVEFGAGALPCSDIYVASGGELFRYTMGTAAGANVPWHRSN